MPTHTATITWTLPAGVTADDFRKGKYSREHTWSFDAGIVVPASPNPGIVPKPWSTEKAVDPEEAFVAAVASCHMLTYIWLAGKKGFVLSAYTDTAEGRMTKNENGVYWVSHIELRPQIVYSGDKTPTPAEETDLHHHAHEQCFIANSVKSDVTVRPTPAQ